MRKGIKLLIIIISLFIFTDNVYASHGSAGANVGSPIGTSCYPGCAGTVQRCNRVGAVRITFVDKDGNALPAAGGRSYDFLTYNGYSFDVNSRMNTFAGDKNKFAMARSMNIEINWVRASQLYSFADLARAFIEISPVQSSTVGYARVISGGKYSGGSATDGYTKEKQFFLEVAKSTNPNGMKDVQSFAKALAYITGGFNVNELLAKIDEGCNGGEQVFIMMEQMLFWSSDKGQNYLATFADAFHLFNGTLPPGGSYLSEMASIYWYDSPIPAFKATIPIAYRGQPIVTGLDMLNTSGVGFILDWASGGSERDCNPREKCSYATGVFSDETKSYPGNVGFPIKFRTIQDYAFSKTEEGGADCCTTFEQQIPTMPPEWQSAYQRYCAPEEPPNPNCCSIGLQEEPKDKYYNNCCTDDQNSMFNENTLNDLFCYDNAKQINYYLKKCDIYNTTRESKYKDTENDLNPTYCEMYCTERVKFELPKPLEAEAGMYFELSKTTTGGTSAPYIEGYRRCRIRIDYEKWETDYKAQLERVKEAYNRFQDSYANHMMYQAARSQTISGTVGISRACERKSRCSKQVPTPCSGPTTRSASGQAQTCTKTEWYDCWVDAPSVNGTANFSFLLWTFPTMYPVNPVKVQQTAHTKIEMVYDNQYMTSHASQVTEGMDAAISSVNSQASSLHCPERDKGTSRGTLPLEGMTREAVSSNKSAWASKQSSDNGAFVTEAQRALGFQQTLDQCDHYFDRNSSLGATYSGLNAKNMYKFEPHIGFRYSQIFLTEDAILTEDQQSINFDGECRFQTISQMDDRDGDTFPPNYSGLFGSGAEVMIDFKPSAAVYDQTRTRLTSMLKTYNADKRFTNDGKFQVKCAYEETSEEKYTLYPSGYVSASEEENFTVKDKRYKVYLTALDGTYQTYWDLSNIGHKGAMDTYFKDSKTCAQETNLTSNFTCKIAVRHKIIYVGKCNGSNGTDTTINRADCDYTDNAKPVFNFKVVDPTRFFPNGTNSPDGEFAYNWVHDSTGQTVMGLINGKATRDELFSPNNVSYEFIISPESMKIIREYNASREQNNIGGYSDFNLTCRCDHTVNSGIPCQRCESKFLTDLAKYGIVQISTYSTPLNIWHAGEIDNVRHGLYGWNS